MKQMVTWMRGKICSWFAKKTAGRVIASAGAVATVAVCTANPVSWGRVVVAIVATLLVPLVAFVPVRAVVAKRSNGANAALLLAFMAFNALCAAWSVRWTVDSGLAALVAAVIVAAGLFYNVWIMTFALRLEDK